jgi:hypothetical protein
MDEDEILNARQVAEQNPELDATRRQLFGENYLQDIDQGTGIAQYYTGFGQMPTLDYTPPVVEEAAPVVDTTPVVDAGGGGGQDQATGDLDLGGNTDFEQNLIDQGIGVQASPGDPVGAAFEEQLTQEAIDDLADYPITQPMTGGITGDPIEVGIPDNESGFVDPLGTISGPPVVGDFNEPTTTQGSLSQVQVPDLDYSSPQIGDPGFEKYKPSFEPEQQGLINQAFSKVGSTAENIMDDLSKIPGAVANFAEQTVDVFGKKINVGKTLLSAGINKLVGGPISLVFDAIGALGLEGGRSDMSDALGEQYGMDDIGRLTGGPMEGYSVDSAFGDIGQAAQDRIDTIQDTITRLGSTPEREQKINELEGFIEQVNAYETGVPQEDIGAIDTISDLEIAAGIQAADEEPAPSGDGPQGVDAGTADIQDFADVYDPPAPAPTPSYSPPSYSGGGGQGGGGGANIGGGQQTSSGGPGGFSSGQSGGWGWAKGGIVSLKNAKR